MGLKIFLQTFSVKYDVEQLMKITLLSDKFPLLASLANRGQDHGHHQGQHHQHGKLVAHNFQPIRAYYSFGAKIQIHGMAWSLIS